MFGIFKTIMDVKKGVRDPGGLGKELALDIIKVPLLLFTILGGLFLVFMFILAFAVSRWSISIFQDSFHLAHYPLRTISAHRLADIFET